jgi:GNAT superfamily N-acetyltransferase
MLYKINEDKIEYVKIEHQINEDISLKINNLNNYEYDQFRYFPSKYKDGWKLYLQDRLNIAILDNETFTFYSEYENFIYLIALKITKWDEDIFGYKIANTFFSILPETSNSLKIIQKFFYTILKFLKKNGIKLLNFRVHGDNLSVIHLCEDIGFKYYENIIWPYTNCIKRPIDSQEYNIRLMKNEELERVKEIAFNFQYSRGHLYCDNKIDKTAINILFSKWIQSYWEKGEPIAVIDYKGDISGYLVMKGIDKQKEKCFGYKYGQLSSMAFDPKYRGLGFGKNIIKGGINILNDIGVEIVDTGLATKNLFSQSSIRVADFRNYYEEITFHYWF